MFNRKNCDNCGGKDHLGQIFLDSDPLGEEEQVYLCASCRADYGTVDLDIAYRKLTPKRPALKQFDNDYKESLK